MTEISLSIVIPTYNRASKLNYLLSSLFGKSCNFHTDVEVVILDNASADNTEDVVSNFSKSYPIKYLKREKNIGMDANIASCFDAANGKYLWVLGDDEILYRGTLDYVLNLCRVENFGILYMENRGFQDGEENKVELISVPGTPDVITLSSEKMFREVNVFLTFISANIVNKSAVINSFPEFNSRSDTNTFLPQMAWMYSALKSVDQHFFVRSPMLGALTGNTGGYKLIEVFGINLINITKKYFDKSLPAAANIMSNAVITRLLPGEIIRQNGESSAKSKFEHEDVKKAIYSCFENKIYFKIFLKPILSGSVFKRKISFFFVRVFNRVNKKIRYAML